jgi:hypothetical protein
MLQFALQHPIITLLIILVLVDLAATIIKRA